MTHLNLSYGQDDRCGHCGMYHPGMRCPLIASIEYYETGQIKKIEYIKQEATEVKKEEWRCPMSGWTLSCGCKEIPMSNGKFVRTCTVLGCPHQVRAL